MDDDAVLRALSDARPDHDSLDGAVVIGYGAVVEWMAPDGTRWLTLSTGDAGGNDLQSWQVQGYFHNVLHDPHWQDGEE
jgi:hypothetical protein